MDLTFMETVVFRRGGFSSNWSGRDVEENVYLKLSLCLRD